MKKFLFILLGISIFGHSVFAQTYGWVQMGPGLNPLITNQSPGCVCTDLYGNVYEAGSLWDTNGYSMVAKWNGINWVELGNGINFLYAAGDIESICADQMGNIYAAGDLLDSNYNSCVAKWDGNSWSELGTGSTALTGGNGSIYSICADKSGNIYAAGQLMDYNGYYYVAHWNGSNWSELGASGYNPLNANNPITTICTDTFGDIYAAGSFTDSNGYYYLAGLNPNVDDSWSELGALNANSVINAICSDPAANIYVATEDTSTQTGYVAKWNGLTWTTLYPGSQFPQILYPVTSLCSDPFGNVYAGSFFDGSTDQVGILATFIAKINNGNWIKVGTGNNSLNATSDVYAMCTNASGNIYAVAQYVIPNNPYYPQPAPDVKEYQLLLSVNLGVNQTVCEGSFITLNPLVSGFYPPFTYRWQSLSGDTLTCNTCQNPQLVINQNSSYIVEVTDAMGDTATATIQYNISANVNQMSLALNNVRLTCGNDSTVVNLTGPFLPCDINWGDSDIYANLSQLEVNHVYSGPGNYVVSVSDSMGCVVSAVDSVIFFTISTQLVQDIPAGCQNNGQLEVSVVNGQAPFGFIWSNGDTSAFITNLQAGSYSVTVSDSNGCYFDTAYLVNYETYYTYLTESNTNCSNNGSITEEVYGGFPPYTFIWNNGDTDANLQNLSPGNYYVTVTDSFGCVTTGYTQVTSNCVSFITGNVFIDTSGACIYTGQQTALAGVTLTLSGGNQTLYATTDSFGFYSFQADDTGSYYLYIQVGNGTCGNYTLCGNPGQTLYISVLGDSLVGNNFGFVPSSSSFDLYLHPGWTSADPGFEKDYWIYFANNSSIPFTGSATVIFKYDSNLVFLSSDIPYTTYDTSADSITWVVSNFNNSGTNYIGRVRFNVPATLPLNYRLQSQFWIYPYIGDCDTSNNYLRYSDPISGSHDPNYKMVSPTGYVTNADSVFTYTIHFQNTGTDSTHFIIVRDTLSPYLNPASVRNLASSDNYSDFDITGTGVLTWTFNPLRLPPLTTDSIGSNGFIVYSVKKMPDIPFGISITNSATVYFDYNGGITTDTVADTTICIPITILDTTVCSGTIVLFNGVDLSSSGSYNDTLTGSSGCDSVVTLNLTVLPVAYTVNQTICAGQSFDGYDITGTYVDSLSGSSGCDSIVTLNLTVLPIQDSTLNVSICAGQNYNGYDTTGTYVDTLTGSNGCDSIVTINLTVLPLSYTNDTEIICQGQSYGGFSSTGVYADTLTSSNGCDSIYTLYLTVLPVFDSTLNVSICTGLSYNGFDSTGTYVDTLTGSNGCDSIVTLNLTVLPLSFTTDTQIICAGQNYNGYDSTGTYIDTLTGSNGCDSIAMLYLTVLPVYDSSYSVSICPGQSYSGHDTTGVYLDTLTGLNGCDSIVTLNLTVNNVITTNLPNATTCEGAPYNFNGAELTATGMYADTLTSSAGCDSMVVLNLTVNPVYIDSSSDTICAGHTYEGDSLSGIYADTLTSVSGCDSIIILNLIISPNPYPPFIMQSNDTLTSSEVAISYQWYLNDTLLAGDTSVEIVALQNGNYQVEITGPNNCSTISESYTYPPTGIQSVNSGFDVKLYPNPNNGSFVVEFSDNTIKEVCITDVLGQTIAPYRKVTLKTEFDLSALESGVYFLKIMDPQNANQFVFRQVVVQR